MFGWWTSIKYTCARLSVCVSPWLALLFEWSITYSAGRGWCADAAAEDTSLTALLHHCHHNAQKRGGDSCKSPICGGITVIQLVSEWENKWVNKWEGRRKHRKGNEWVSEPAARRRVNHWCCSSWILTLACRVQIISCSSQWSHPVVPDVRPDSVSGIGFEI